MNHVLSLEVLDTLNPGILKITDTSHYEEMLDVTCSRLEILLPGFTIPVVKDVEPMFNLVLNACDLEVQKSDCGTKFCNLPDGIYSIRYSVSPNEIVKVEYNYLKVSMLMNRYKKALCCIDLNAYEPSKEIKEKLKLLHEVRMYIEAAKAKAENCHEPEKSMELYNYANKILSKFDCVNCK